MKNYVVYNPVTGGIIRCGVCEDADFEYQPRTGEAVLESEGRSDGQDIVSGGAVIENPDYVLHNTMGRELEIANAEIVDLQARLLYLEGLHGITT